MDEREHVAVVGGQEGAQVLGHLGVDVGLAADGARVDELAVQLLVRGVSSRRSRCSS